MITLSYLLRSEPFMRAMLYGYDEAPIYARVDGTLFQVDEVSRGAITTSMGAHDCIILDVSSKSSEEA